MTTFGHNWRTAVLPPKTALFAIGDIHGQAQLLRPMLASIEEKIANLPPDVTAHVVFIGDYIDRGKSAPETIDMLLDFERRMQATQNVKTTFLCGNHDEYFTRLLACKNVTDHILGNPDDPKDYRACASEADGSLTVRGLENWLFSGGGASTVQDYLLQFDKTLFNKDGNELIGGVNTAKKLIEALAQHVPPAHKDFFARAYANSHLILGNYLLTHAGIDPKKTLKEQGIGPGAAPLKGLEYLDFLMLRNPFLWRGDNELPNCPYVVVHGHTPSEIKSDIRDILDPARTSASGYTQADGQKDYRLCIDTDVYKTGGALTCFMRTNDEASFMAVKSDTPERVEEYSIPQVGQWVASIFHARLHPKYHPEAFTAGPRGP